ncbi:LuxS/MPP-like metallohydrolase [Punctularia strigosozonata HHB-11173 SS5]|uniref:LuxS/MPP-like metallohydrolase n=1 Tax=Punctularia strigosozonata (strain HHB-11173) TaxID=741275 RepID=UPI0004416BBC|nr:LuxS/MPP-like metallohydrolase [Punctularia strigosozonata HHB-11173 SS5]EIN13923.1 LuxS/MPP-like metallohydrolase [Punctularia strigosozonata HHB-11173 SS5]
MHHTSRTALRRSLKRVHQRTLSTSAPAPPVQITTLPNKIRVATEATPSHFSALGLYVDAGSRYETPSTLGVSHFVDRLAFKTTATRSQEEMSAAIDQMGGQIMCASARESMMYQSTHFHQANPLALSLIADTVINPAFLDDEISLQRDAARYEIREINSKPDMILPEILHEVAYDGKTLGIPLLCPEERIDHINRDCIREYMQRLYTPERMVVAGAGMQHEELVELVDKYFSSLKPTTFIPPHPLQPTSRQNNPQHPVAPHLIPKSPGSLYKSLTRAASYLTPSVTLEPGYSSVLNPQSTYTGGHRFLHREDSEFNHLYLAFEGVSIHDDDIYALATMQVLLGGGGSFSAGGPGKGMYSRLYTHILNHYPQVDHCASFHHIYSDSSLFGLFASFVPKAGRHHGNTADQILPHLVHQLSLLLYAPVSETELSRAKNQLKSSLMMALESRAVEVEDLGRQILVHGRKISVSEMCEKVDELTPESIRKTAERVFGPRSGNKATIVCMGRDDVRDWKGVLRKYSVAGA